METISWLIRFFIWLCALGTIAGLAVILLAAIAL